LTELQTSTRDWRVTWRTLNKALDLKSWTFTESIVKEKQRDLLLIRISNTESYYGTEGTNFNSSQGHFTDCIYSTVVVVVVVVLFFFFCSNVAVFAAILATGLKIMPHAGGRVGKGLYFADMINKSQGYCGLHGNVGLILLNEVVLGNQFKILQDRPDLKAPPAGYDSVLACGNVMPNPNKDFVEYELNIFHWIWKSSNRIGRFSTALSPSGHPVVIPQAKEYSPPIGRSSFMHNEYLGTARETWCKLGGGRES